MDDVTVLYDDVTYKIDLVWMLSQLNVDVMSSWCHDPVYCANEHTLFFIPVLLR